MEAEKISQAEYLKRQESLIESWQTLPLNTQQPGGYPTPYFVMSVLSVFKNTGFKNTDSIYLYEKSRCCDVITDVLRLPYVNEINDYKYVILTPIGGGKFSNHKFNQCRNLMKSYLKEVGADDFMFVLSENKARILYGIPAKYCNNRRILYIFTKIIRFFWSADVLPLEWREAIKYFCKTSTCRDNKEYTSTRPNALINALLDFNSIITNNTVFLPDIYKYEKQDSRIRNT